jgi:hypothetical protein
MWLGEGKKQDLYRLRCVHLVFWGCARQTPLAITPTHTAVPACTGGGRSAHPGITVADAVQRVRALRHRVLRRLFRRTQHAGQADLVHSPPVGLAFTRSNRVPRQTQLRLSALQTASTPLVDQRDATNQPASLPEHRRQRNGSMTGGVASRRSAASARSLYLQFSRMARSQIID